MLAGLDRVLLRRQAERVPAHRMQHVEAAHPLVARDDVRRGVALRMSDVQPGAARVRKHVEHVKLRLRRIEAGLAGIRRVKAGVLVPETLPLRLDLIERIGFAALAAHEKRESQSQLSNERNVPSEVEPRRPPLQEPVMPRLLIATKNAHKTAEIRAMLGRAWEIDDLTAHPEIVPAEETGATFAENAMIKAVAARAISRGSCSPMTPASRWTRSAARLASSPRATPDPPATDADNRALLLTSLSGWLNRRARFRCVIVLARKGRVLVQFEGEVEGEIAEAERGRAGFGYDPLFIPMGNRKTFSELQPSAKNKLSHRDGPAKTTIVV